MVSRATVLCEVLGCWRHVPTLCVGDELRTELAGNTAKSAARSRPKELVDHAPVLEEDRFDLPLPVAVHEAVPPDSQAMEAGEHAGELLGVPAALGEVTKSMKYVSSLIGVEPTEAGQDLLGDDDLHSGTSSSFVHFVLPAS